MAETLSPTRMPLTVDPMEAGSTHGSISPSTKRQRSHSPEIAPPKRPRRSDGSAASPSTIGASPAAIEPLKQEPAPDPRERRKNSIQEEKKRGQRLFGGLLSTLSRSTPDGQQKRRAEIEKRQAAKAAQQAIDNKAREAEKLAKLKEVRRKQQIKVDEESMRTRHANMLAMANFLRTKAEPRLYYKPWELLPADEDHIQAQITEATIDIKRESDEFYSLHPHLTKPRKITPPSTETRENQTNIASEEIVGEPEAESPPVSNALNDTTNDPVQAKAAVEKDSTEEQNGEVVVEAEEDTVIY